MENEPEFADLVDKNDNIIGRMPVDDFHDSKNQHSRAVNIFIRNRNGDLWIPRRHPSKRRWPNSLDFSASGHISSGEDYIDGAIREIMEELGISVDSNELRLLGKVTPYTHTWSPCFVQYYELLHDKVFYFNTEDFTTGGWISPKELHALLKSENEPLGKPALPFAVEHFYL